MLREVSLLLLPLAALTADDSWKTKRAAEWTEEQTKQVLNDSPWAVTVITIMKKEDKPHPKGGGIGIPGITHRRQQQTDPTDDTTTTQGANTGPAVHLRWESALPIREAELKARETNAPVVDEEHYGIAVYGIPSHFTKNLKGAPEQLKGQASLKRDGQKELKPSHVDVLERDDGIVIVYLFPRKLESADQQVTFEAMIGPYQLTQAFHIDQMTYQGKLEL